VAVWAAASGADAIHAASAKMPARKQAAVLSNIGFTLFEYKSIAEFR
jgi:hypothetical protein